MEGMVNIRLLHFFDQKGTPQCEGRGKQTLINYVLSLEATVRKARANSEQVVSIFFVMEKAYDSTWRHAILMDIQEAGIEERVFNFIKKNFVEPSSFKVKVNEIPSDAKAKTEGIPQGRAVSLKIFMLKINKIVAQFPNDNRFQISLYMFDLQICKGC